MGHKKDYYATLGVTPLAEDVVIRAAYKALAQRYHPNRYEGTATEAHKRMAEINEAYNILSEPRSRKNYDEQHHSSEEKDPPASNDEQSVNHNINTPPPEGVKGVSLGAFFLTIFWSIGNRVWIGLFSLVPILGYAISFYLGFKGRELAWKARRWESLEKFNSTQRKWSIATIVLIPAIIGLHAVVAINAYQGYIEKINGARDAINNTKETYNPLPIGDKIQLSKTELDDKVAKPAYSESPAVQVWLKEMTRRLATTIPDAGYRDDFIKTLHYESIRAGVDPELIMGIIEVESGFRKYAVSPNGELKGYMQIPEYLVEQIGSADHNLFHLRTNLRYGCTILRYYIDAENGDLYSALQRYNKNPSNVEYSNAVYAAWRKHWTYGISQE
jgi:hypothetical protein